jgi:hypothetical protein
MGELEYIRLSERHLSDFLNRYGMSLTNDEFNITHAALDRLRIRIIALEERNAKSYKA